MGKEGTQVRGPWPHPLTPSQAELARGKRGAPRRRSRSPLHFQWRGVGGEATARAIPLDRLAAPLTALIVAIAWELGVRLTDTPAYLVPAPSAIVLRTARDWQFFAAQAGITLEEAFAGLFLASVTALSAAVLMAQRPWAERAIFPLAVAVKVTPIVAVAPLFIVWFGFGPTPKVLVAALISFFPILSNAMTGFRSVNPRTLDLFRSLDASPFEIFRELRLPHALPYLFSGYKVATTLSVIGAVVAEWIGADSGLGHVIILANSNFDMVTVAAAVFVLAIIGICLYLVTNALERRCLFWHESTLTTRGDQ